MIETSGVRTRYLCAGVIRLHLSADFDSRLLSLYDEIQGLTRDHRPDEVAIEDVFHAKFAQSALKLGHARGVIIVAVKQSNLAVSSYPPALVKKVISGYGKADKTQIARMMAALLGVPKLPSHDATDALAVAVTHARARTLQAPGLNRRPI